MAKQRYYPVRDPEDPRKVTLEPINEEVYRTIYPEIWRTQKQMQRLGRCVCPPSKLWACDGDCVYCNFKAVGKVISSNTPVHGERTVEDLVLEDVFTDDSSPSPEEIVMNQESLAALYKEMERLDPESQNMCRLFLEGKHEREIAEILGLSRSTYKRRWDAIKAKLRYKLEDYA